MKGLICKDCLILRKTIISYLIVAVIYGAMTLAGCWPPGSFTAVIGILITLMPYSCFSYDLSSHWDTYALALPLSRRRIVLSRYLVLLLLLLICLVFFLLCGALFSLTGALESPTEYLMICAGTLGAGSLMNAILFPLIYRFGPERARVLLFAAIGLLFGLGYAAVQLGALDALDALVLTNGAAWIALAAVLICSLAALAVSYWISAAIYSRKEG